MSATLEPENAPFAVAIETSTAHCSVALGSSSSYTQLIQEGVNIHSKVLLKMVQKLLNQAQAWVDDLSFIAASNGPGSFTGLRIGVGVAQGLAYGADKPMVGVSSLDCLAQQVASSNQPAHSVLTGIDARMGEIYCGQYTVESGLSVLAGERQLLSPGQVMVRSSSTILAGNAWSVYWSQLDDSVQKCEHVLEQFQAPKASALLSLACSKYLCGDVVDPCQFQTDYLRNNVAKKAS